MKKSVKRLLILLVTLVVTVAGLNELAINNGDYKAVVAAGERNEQVTNTWEEEKTTNYATNSEKQKESQSNSKKSDDKKSDDKKRNRQDTNKQDTNKKNANNGNTDKKNTNQQKDNKKEEQKVQVVFNVTSMDAIMHAVKDCKIYELPSADTKKIGSLVEGQAILVTGQTDTGYYQVDFCEMTGYLEVSLLQNNPPAPEYTITDMDVVMYAVSDCNINREPKDESKTMGSLVADQAILVTGMTDTGFYRVDFCGEAGFMRTGLLKDAPRVKERHEYTEAELIQMVLAECVTPGMSDREKAVAINDYLCGFCQYDDSLTYRSTFDALTHGQVVCQGYANAYKKLMEAAGVKTDYISGKGWTGTEWGSHGWNRVTIDGVYYYVDVTWNDCLSRNHYLLMDYDTFHYDHYQQRVNPYRIE